MNRAQREAALAPGRPMRKRGRIGPHSGGHRPQYQSARNQAAGQSEQRKRPLPSHAAAQGLNPARAGRPCWRWATRSRTASGIGQAEASTMADLELQRSQMETDYNNAIAQAEAQGNYELAQQLYQEKVRQTSPAAADAVAGPDGPPAAADAVPAGPGGYLQPAVEPAVPERGRQWNRQWAYQQAQELARYGDFSGYRPWATRTSRFRA